MLGECSLLAGMLSDVPVEMNLDDVWPPSLETLLGSGSSSFHWWSPALAGSVSVQAAIGKTSLMFIGPPLICSLSDCARRKQTPEHIRRTTRPEEEPPANSGPGHHPLVLADLVLRGSPTTRRTEPTGAWRRGT